MIPRRLFLAGLAVCAAPVPLRAAAQRVLIVGGDLVEIAWALGAGSMIVGADTTATFPPEVEALPKVGYMRRISAEGALSLSPDLVILAGGAGPAAAVDALSAAGLRIARAPGGDDLSAIPAKIAFMGEALGRAAEAAALIARHAARMEALSAALSGVEARPPVLFLMSAGRGAPMAAGAGTAAQTIIELAHGRNAVAGYEGYKPLSAEAALAAAPEAILLPSHAVGPLGGVEAALARPEIAPTPAGRAGRAIVMDGLKLLGLGPRTPEAAAELAMALHPGLKIAGLP